MRKEIVKQLRIWLFEYLQRFSRTLGGRDYSHSAEGGFLFRSLAALRDFFGSQEDSLS